MKRMIVVLGMLLLTGTAAFATPSTQIWIPSTDVQPFLKWHLGFDQYVKVRGLDPSNRESNVINNGVTVGVLPFDKLQLEVGVDLRHVAAEEADSNPVYFNAKLGAPEGSLFTGSPAFAVGGYDFGTRAYDSIVNFGTNYNIAYALAAKTFGVLGRISIGYYQGNDKLLLDAMGRKDGDGMMASWDRTISELSDNLWLAVDYMSGRNAYGAVSCGAAWKFAPNVGVILGYDRYNNRNFKPTYTLQADIDF